jgi:hypothetical protein
MGEPVDFPVNTWLSSIMDTPPPVGGTAAQVGFDLTMKPLISVSLEVTRDAPYTGNYDRQYYPVVGYHYRVTEGARLVEEGNVPSGATAVAFGLDPNNFPAAEARSYVLRAYAYNGYSTGHGGTYDPRWSADIPFSTVAGPVVGLAAPVTINIKRTRASGLGINSFSVPRASSEVVSASKEGAAVTPTITPVWNAVRLCRLINEINGGPLVRTFGAWDEVNQVEKGVVITYSGTAIDSLEPGRGYQVYVKPDPDNNVNISITLR